jgi:O-antigen/teichoic acid export membrane protein
MSLVRRNVFANSAGRLWAAGLSLAVVPLQIHFVGIEAYGLLGVFQSLAAIFSLLDLGLGNVLNRELARYSVQDGGAQAMRDLVRTIEAAYWAIGIAIGVCVALLAAPIADHWLQAAQMPRASLVDALVLMGIALACQWPRSLYYSGLMGLQSQVVANVASAAVATVLNVGGVLILWQLSASITALLAWYAAVGLLEALVVAWLLWRALPRASAPASLAPRLLAGQWRFAVGMTAVSATSILLTQIDKIILSKALPLEAFGYYSLAARVAGGLFYLIVPVTTAYFPRFSQLVASGRREELAPVYHKGCQVMSVAVLPAAAILALYPAELLQLWTRDAAIVANSSAILAVLALGNALNGMMGLPAALQFAYGWTRLVFVFNAVAVALFAPLVYVMAARHGGLGAAFVWLTLNVGYVAVMLPLMHRRLLAGELASWLRRDFGAPLAAAFAAAGAWRLVVPGEGSAAALLGIAAAAGCAVVAAGWAAVELRPALARALRLRY